MNGVAPQLLDTAKNHLYLTPDLLAHAVVPNAIDDVIVSLVSDAAEEAEASTRGANGHGAVHGAARHRAGIFPWLQVPEAVASGHLRELPITDQQPLVRDSALIRCVASPPLAARRVISWPSWSAAPSSSRSW